MIFMEKNITKIKVNLKDRDDVRTMFFLTSDHNIVGYIESANTRVSANSILGLFTLAFNTPHIVEINPLPKTDIEGFIKDLKERGIECSPVVSYSFNMNSNAEINKLSNLISKYNISGMVANNLSSFGPAKILDLSEVDLSKPITLELFDETNTNINAFINEMKKHFNKASALEEEIV